MKNIIKTLVLSFLFVFTFSAAKPAKAFYLEVPQALKNLLTSLKSNKAFAQTTPTATPTTTTGSSAPMPYPDNSQSYPTPTQGTQQYPSGDQYKQYQGTHQYPTQGTQQYPTPPSGDQYKQYQGQQGQGVRGNYGPDQGQGMHGGQDSGQQLEQIKRSMKQMARQVKQFEQMIASAEKKGTAVPEEVKQKLAKLKGILDSVQNAKSMEDLQDVDMSEIGDLMQSLEEFRRNVVEGQQRMEGMKRGMKGMEMGLKMFERQVANLTKKGITVPAPILEHIAKLKSIIDKVKIAKSFDEIQEDMESMQDLMETFDQDRQQLEVLARWPQTLKQIDQQLARLIRELARSKAIVDRLAKKGIDLQTQYTAFADAVNKLKSVRDDVVAKMAAGDSEGAFSALEDDFFGQMDDVWQHQRVIMMMSNLGRFTSEFKRNLAQANLMVKNLKRKGIDTADLAGLVQQASTKGQEIIELLKAKPLDEDAIVGALDELENLKQEFEAKVDELTGVEDELPWEQGPQQFRKLDLPQGFDKLVPQRQESQT